MFASLSVIDSIIKAEAEILNHWGQWLAIVPAFGLYVSPYQIIPLFSDFTNQKSTSRIRKIVCFYGIDLIDQYQDRYLINFIKN